MKKYDKAIFIGRFQPFHNSHLFVCKEALKLAEHLVILVGSSNSSRSLKNPFSYQERKQVILDSLGCKNVTVIGLRDYHYSDNMWVAHVQDLVESVPGANARTCLVGLDKDESTYYLNLFPKYKFEEIQQETLLHATNIRDLYFEDTAESYTSIEACVPNETRMFLDEFHTGEHFHKLREEHEVIHAYKKMYKDATRLCGTFPPVFVTVDAVVTCGGHVLLVKRRGYPGKGLRALPGGFLNQYEKIEDACIRELREETRIKIPPAVLRGSITDSKVFDYPSRSSRGRTITHVYHIDLKERQLPRVKGSDDAEKAGWFPLNEVMRQPEDFFEDHYHIIEYFINRN